MNTRIRNFDYNLRLIVVVFFLLIICGGIVFKWKTGNSEKVTVRIDVAESRQKSLIEKYLPAKVNLKNVKYLEASVNWKQFFQLQKAGLNPELQVEVEHDDLIDDNYHTFSEITYLLKLYSRDYAHIVSLEKIGYGSQTHLPIWALKISDNPQLDEQEPAVLFTGVHHAKEILSAEVCLYLINYLCKNYDVKPEVNHWVNNEEIWIVPVINPDGHYWVMDQKFSLFWRKNMKDNNSNGIFELETDGVDLNRNYDFNWNADGDPDPRSWHYRGPYPFSESETKAIRDLTFREKFVFHLDFHSYGEVILYPWENFTAPPDRELVIEIAGEIARHIKKRNCFDHYTIRPLNGKLGQCSVWMHGKAGVLSYIVEVGDSHIPEARDVNPIVEENAKAGFYALDRVLKSAIKGIVRNAYSRTPIAAEIEILEYSSPVVSNPASDGETGYYYRIVRPGVYTLKFSAPNFRTKIIYSVVVEMDKVTSLDVDLFPIEDIIPTEN